MYGRLGNNIRQLLNVIFIGLHHNWNIIIPKHKKLNTTYIVINKKKNNKSLKYVLHQKVNILLEIIKDSIKKFSVKIRKI